jgi:hypothetical protein
MLIFCHFSDSHNCHTKALDDQIHGTHFTAELLTCSRIFPKLTNRLHPEPAESTSQCHSLFVKFQNMSSSTPRSPKWSLSHYSYICFLFPWCALNVRPNSSSSIPSDGTKVTFRGVNQPKHVSDMCTVHHQEVFTVYVQQLVRVIRLSWLGAGRVRMEPLLTRPAAGQL